MKSGLKSSNTVGHNVSEHHLKFILLFQYIKLGGKASKKDAELPKHVILRKKKNQNFPCYELPPKLETGKALPQLTEAHANQENRTILKY